MRLLVCVPLLALALGCAGAPANPPPAAPHWAFASATPSAGKEVRLRSESRYVQVSIEGNAIFGPTWNLTHGPDFIRGYGPGNAQVDATLKATRTDGNYKNAPFSVQIERQDDGVTQVTGLFAGAKLSAFSISPKIFKGYLGKCSYDLTFNGNRYEGMSSCAGSVQITSLELPAGMSSWSDLESATVLAIVLGT